MFKTKTSSWNIISQLILATLFEHLNTTELPSEIKEIRFANVLDKAGKLLIKAKVAYLFHLWQIFFFIWFHLPSDEIFNWWNTSMTFSLINMFPMKRNIKDNLKILQMATNSSKCNQLEWTALFTRQPINYSIESISTNIKISLFTPTFDTIDYFWLAIWTIILWSAIPFLYPSEDDTYSYNKVKKE